jgi:hypothetical protein
MSSIHETECAMTDVLPFRRRDAPPAEDDGASRDADGPSTPSGDAKPASLKAARRRAAKARAKGTTLCRRGFHDWSVDAGTRFDVKEGRLVTRVRCARCDATRNELR